MARKPLAWVGSARAEIQKFPALARREAGHDLWLVQSDEAPRDWRPMPDVGAGTIELRIHAGTEHRVFYVSKFEEAIYVLHAFEKPSRKTSPRDLKTGRDRYRQLVAARAARRG
jgi:phage-related protein